MTYRIGKEATTKMKLKIYRVSYHCYNNKTKSKLKQKESYRFKASNKDRPAKKLK